LPAAVDHYDVALTHSRLARWREAEAGLLSNLAAAHAEAGRLDVAAELFEQALGIHRSLGSHHRVAITLGNMGLLHASLGNLETAARVITEALDLHRSSGSIAVQAIVLTNLADIEIDAGRLDDAWAHATEALRLARQVGRIDAEIMAQLYLSDIHRLREQIRPALTCAHHARDLLPSVGDPEIAGKVHLRLGAALHSADQLPAAVEEYQLARRITADNERGVLAVRICIALATVHRDLGDLGTARSYADQAIASARAAGYRLLERRARALVPDDVTSP
jgi:tetratricopeptide (TPR) repeat protein